jgi:autophagy-related protein 27
MLLPRIHDTISVLSVLLSLPTLSQAVGAVDCKNVVVKSKRYDLSKLAGAHEVHWVRTEDLIKVNTTFAVDVCGHLGRRKDLEKDEQCPPQANSMCFYSRYHCGTESGLELHARYSFAAG